MIRLYYWPTPNGHKITIMLEECGLEYEIIPVNIGRGDQFEPDFLAISPNNRMPALVDTDAPGRPLSVFESGAILTYLAEKTGRFMPNPLHDRFEVLQWLFWQVGGLGPMAGQLSHFVNYAPEDVPYARKRYADEYDRLIGVMERRLADRPFLAGEYSIADMASWPWLRSYKRLGQSLDAFPEVQRWHEAMKSRPAVQRAIDIGKDWQTPGEMGEQARKILFGQTAASVSARKEE